mmetsp:Transcript_49805/g.83501  ORF Transcript_49805/g.83501 Transcript_49805/m.83501 type:complete len:90 (-) Transcript_49805:569-838(-)
MHPTALQVLSFGPQLLLAYSPQLSCGLKFVPRKPTFSARYQIPLLCGTVLQSEATACLFVYSSIPFPGTCQGGWVRIPPSAYYVRNLHW